jgi:serine/threonine-protein kinase ULK/ATG1
MAQVRTLKSKKLGGEYTFGEVLGKGAQACVYKFYKDTGEVYATKMTPVKDYLCTKDEKKNQRRWKAIVRELCILETLNSRYVIKPIEFIRTANNLYLVQEFANGGSM